MLDFELRIAGHIADFLPQASTTRVSPCPARTAALRSSSVPPLEMRVMEYSDNGKGVLA